jgi:hypothetical protein
MLVSFGQCMLYRRWLVSGCLAAGILVALVITAPTGSFNPINMNLLTKIILLAAMVWLVTGAVLTRFNNHRPRPTFRRPTSTANGFGDRPCVLLVENESLLGAGVQSLLGNQSEFDLIGVMVSTEIELVKAIEIFEPSIVILSETSYPTDFTRLMAVLRVHPAINVVTVSAADNLVHMYAKKQMLVTRAIDLVNIIKHNLCLV